MTAKRVDMHRLQELVRLHRLHRSDREVARTLRMGRNTHRRYRDALVKADLLAGDADDLPALADLRRAVDAGVERKLAPQQTSSAEPWREAMLELVERGCAPQAIHDTLRLREPSFTVSLSAVKRYCARLKKERGVRPEDVAIPVETEPGEVAQVDFGYVGRLYDPTRGVLRRAWVFVMTLGHSRHQYAEVVFDQKAQTWQSLHVHAFEHFGGVPKVVVPDNLKAAVVRAAFSTADEVAINRSYREIARHYGFLVDPTPPRSPEKKGKVEAGVKYVKRSFFAPREGLDRVTANRELLVWIREIAGRRVHGTTHRRPLEVFEREERAALAPLPRERFEPIVWRTAKVHPDGHVAFEKRLYSVPWRRIGEQVWVKATPSTVAIYADEERIATHPRRGEGPRSTDEAHLPDHRRDLRHRGRTYWERRAARLGEDVRRYVVEVFDSDDVVYQLRNVQASVTHLEKYPDSRANRACARALAFGNLTVGGLKNILRRGLDLEPLPDESKPASRSPEKPRFARSVHEILLSNLGDPS